MMIVNVVDCFYYILLTDIALMF